MESTEKKYRCFTIHYFFKIIGCEKFKDELGYILSETTINKAVKGFDSFITEKAYLKTAEFLKKEISIRCEVPIENVISLTCEEYESLVDSSKLFKQYKINTNGEVGKNEF